MSLAETNHYSRKLSGLRSNAIVQARRIIPAADENGKQLEAMIEQIFGPSGDRATRVKGIMSLNHLRETGNWRIEGEGSPEFTDGMFPLEILQETRRGYLVTIGKQMNGCLHNGWLDACSVMMRRLLETTILELFEASGISEKIKKNGEFVMLRDLVSATLTESSWNLSRTTKSALPKLKELGDLSAHSRTFTTRNGDIDPIRMSFRVAVEELLRQAKLLPAS